ncbi:MAG: hypothetical protein JKY55_06180 [Aliivibrio sp.]|uniref:hypothetical protein n=1 Tax=Aliivibrio sp. TaxID=1872443 RepID=UPI001A5D1AAE|nr:hypothetical protein [Aliivibrio sp.]
MHNVEMNVIKNAIEKLSRDELLSIQSTISSKINPISTSRHILTETEKEFIRSVFA